MKLWTGQTVSQVGTQVTLLAMPLVAILLLHASAFEVGLLTAAEFAPFLIVGLPAGVWVDRLRRRPILIVSDVGRALTLGSVPLANALHVLTLGQLYGVAFVSGVLTVFFDVAYQSYLPSLVDRSRLVEGNSKLEISRSGAQLAGPGLAGVLVQTVGAASAIIVDAVSYVVSVVFVSLIRGSEAPVDRSAPRRRMRTEIKEGLSYVFRHRQLRAIAATTGSANLIDSAILAILVLFAVRELHMSPGLIGLGFAIGNVGALIGAFSGGALARRLGTGPTIVLSAIIFSLSALFIPLAPASMPLPFLTTSLAVMGFGGVVYNVNQVGLRQAITPERMLGRMNATMRFIVFGTMPLGAVTGGALGAAIGLRPALWIFAGVGCLAFLPVLLSPVRSLREVPELPAQDVPTPSPAVAGPVAAAE
jgi:MFS family permease